MRKFAVLLLIACLVGLAGVSPAQEEEDIRSHQVWINEYTEGADMLAYAKREVDKENYKAAIEVYHGLVKKVRKEKEFASRVVTAGEGVYLPLRKRCYEEIIKLPPQGREIYSILYDAKADRLYEQAAAKQDMDGLVLVAQDYLLTPGGKKACLRLADLCIENAEYSLALHYLDTLGNYHYRSAEEPALCALKRAACLLQSGEQAAAKRIIAALMQKKTLDENEKQMCRCLLELCKSAPSTSKDVFNSFYDGFVDLKTPPSSRIVSKPEKGAPDPLEWRFRLERKTVEDPRRSSGYPVTAVGAFGFDLYPVFYNNLVFVNDSTRIYTLAAEGGKIKWREPDEETSKIEGLPLGCFIADGKLFAVLRNTNTYASRRIIRGRAAPAVKALNDMYCFDADHFGDNPALWHTGQMREITDLGETSFTSIPYVDGSRIYVAGIEITEQDKNYCVACFSTSGNFLWQTKFCATKWTGQNTLLRAASLITTRGKVIVCTNVGVAAALSAFTGDLEWIYTYPQGTAADTPPRRGIAVGPTWQAAPPIVWYGTHPADGKPCEALVLAPGDSEVILGFDLGARRLLWRWERTGHSFVIGPRGEDIFVYGGTSLESSDLVVRQHRIPDGLIRWEANLTSEAFEGQDLTFGKGVATPKALYIPCSKQLVEVVDGKDETAYFGRVSAAAAWYSFKKEEEKPETSQELSPEEELRRRILAAQRGTLPSRRSGQQPDETRLRGNLLLLPDRIITSGYFWTNSFKLRKEKDK